MMLLQTSDASTSAVTCVWRDLLFCSKEQQQWACWQLSHRWMHVGIPRTAAPLHSKTQWNAELRENSKANSQRISVYFDNTTLITFNFYKWPKGTHIKTFLASQTSTSLNCSAVCARPTGSDRPCRAGIMALQLYSWLRTQCNALNNSFSAEQRAAARVNIVLSLVY